MTHAPHLPARRPSRLVLPVEAGLLGAALLAVLAIGALSALLGVEVAWADLGTSLRLGGLMMALAVVGRAWGRVPKTADALMAVALFKTVATLVMTLSYFRLALPVAPVDLALERLDAAFGYSWPAAVEAAARHPLTSHVLGTVYLTALPQLALLVVALAGLGRRADLHRFMLTSAAALLGTVALWSLLPSFGPATLHAVAPEVAARVGLVVDAGYVAELHRLALGGIDRISSRELTGAIAFPSFHIVMACLVLWFSRGTALVWLALPVNLAMVPATLVHGGHHLVDLLGGAAVFALALALSHRLVPVGAPRGERGPRLVPA